VLVTGGTPYLVWTTDAGAYASVAEVWSQPLVADGQALAPGSTPEILIRQDQAWETTVENPDLVFDDGQYYLFYSGGYWGSANYAVGYAVCAGPQGPCAKPMAHPILVSSASVSGPGGEFAFRDTTGQWWMAYAAWTAGQVGYPGGARSLRIDPLCFVTGGQGGPADPVVLGPTSTPQPLHQSCPGDDQDDGYRLATPTGAVYPFGDAPNFGGPSVTDAPIVAVTTDPATDGYWELGADGRVYGLGAPFLGDLGGVPLARPAVALVATPDGGGYWLVAADGGVFAYGDASYHGSASTLTLNSPIVGAAATPDGQGYWLVAADGGIFAYGDARFMGSMGGRPLNAAIVGMAAMPDGTGYWLVAADGGVFAFGAAPFRGSTGGLVLNRPIVALVPAGGGGGYWLVASDGGVFAYGAAQFVGSTGGQPIGQPIVGMAAS
jgi:hypothetical protein